MTAQMSRHQFTVAAYAQMWRSGIFREDDRVELLDGEVRTMSPIGPLHAAIVKRLNTILSKLIPATAIVSIQDPIHLSDYTEPQPDVALLHYRADFYAQGHPVADDILMVIEVADSSIEYDRDEKLPRYAQAHIAEVWIIDLNQLTIEQYSQPRNGKYLVKRLLERGDTITSHVLPTLVLAVDAIYA
jgi:Uma2 family endonuclease